MATPESVLRETGTTFTSQLVAALPDLLTAGLFLVLAYVAIRTIQWLTRRSLQRMYPTDQRLIVDFAVLVVGAGLWFAAVLALLTILGMRNIAASMGAASGFVALGVAYALSDVIADTVAGIYLLKDPDFNYGDRVTVDDVTGEVTDIGLRKSRIELDDGDRVVFGNETVDKGWTRQGD